MRMLRLVLLAGIAPVVWGQAMVEYGLGVAAAGTAGAPGKAASRGIAGVFSNLQKTLNATSDAATAPAPSQAAPAATAPAAGQPKRSVAVRPRQSAAVTPAPQTSADPPAPPKPAVVYEDPAGITAGMERAELLARFGDPAVKITAAGRESMTYPSKERTYEVEMRQGKVFSVQSKNKLKQTAVVILQ
jgi:hypothetical protein